MMSDKLILDVDKIMSERDKLILDADRLIYESKKRKEKAKLEVVKSMLDSGMTFEQIKNLTKLPLNKIKGLQKNK